MYITFATLILKHTPCKEANYCDWKLCHHLLLHTFVQVTGRAGGWSQSTSRTTANLSGLLETSMGMWTRTKVRDDLGFFLCMFFSRLAMC